MYFYNLFAPWQETFADAGDGDGGEPFRTILIRKKNPKFDKSKQEESLKDILKYVHIYRK